MPAYRLFPLAPDGRIADAPVVIEAMHDAAVLTQSVRLLDDRTHEVWQLGRFVGVVLGRAASDRLADVRAAFGAPAPSRRRLEQRPRR